MRSPTISNPTTKPHSGRGPLRVLNRAKNVKNAIETERDSVVEDAERLENIAFWLVFGGLAIEIGVVAASFWSLLCPLSEKIAYLIADSAIALGVYGEMRFAGVIGAVLKIRLAEAQQELAHIVSWRIVPPEYAGQMVNELKKIVAPSFQMSSRDTPEAKKLTEQLMGILYNAGWSLSDWTGEGDLRLTWEGQPAIGINTLVGIFVQHDERHSAKFGPPAQALCVMLRGLKFVVEYRVGKMPASRDPDFLYVDVGEKPL